MKPRIFISSVSKEFKSARQLVANTLHAIGFEPDWQDNFETGGEDIRPMLRKRIDHCSAVLQIIGDAYGSEPPTRDETFGRVSYTQYEALYAKSKGKKVYYLIAQNDVICDSKAALIDLPFENTDAGRMDCNERRRLQAEYRVSVQSSEHIYYPIQSHPEAELSVRRLKQDLEKLRRGFRNWMLSVTAAMALIVIGIAVMNQGLWRQEKKIDQTQQVIIQQSEDLKRFAAEVDQPKRIREQLIRTIQRTHDAAIAEAEKLSDWRKRDEARQVANAGRDQNMSRVDELLTSIETIVHSGQASRDYLEMTRVFTEQGAEEAVAFIASRKEVLFGRFEREKELNRKANLLPILESVRKEVLLGRYDAARVSCQELLARDPNWGDALHEQIWILAELGERAKRYSTISQACDLFEQVAENANRLVSLKPSHPKAQRDLSMSHDRMGDVLRQMGEPQMALSHYQASLEISEELAQAELGDANAQRDLSVSHNNLGNVMLQMGKPQVSLTHYQASLKICEQLAHAYPGDALAQRDLFIGYYKLGDALWRLGKPQEAHRYYQVGLKINEQLAQAEPNNALAQRDLFASYFKSGDVLRQIGLSAEAFTHYQDGLKVSEQLAQTDPHDAQAQRDLAASYHRMGDVLLQMGKQTEAFTHFQNGLKIYEQLGQAEPSNAQAQRGLSVSHELMGDVLLLMDEPHTALVHYQASLKIRKQLAPADPGDAQAQRDLFVSYNKLGDMLRRMEEPLAALSYYQEGLKISERLFQAEKSDAQACRDLGVSYDRIGDALLQMGQPQMALMQYQQGLKVTEQLAQADPRDAQVQRDLSVVHGKLGDVMLEMEKAQEAFTHYQTSYKIRVQLAQAEPNNAIAQRDLIASYYKLGELDASEGRLERAVEHFAKGLAVLEHMIELGLKVDTSRTEREFLKSRIEFCEQMKLVCMPWEDMIEQIAPDLLPDILPRRASFFCKNGQMEEVQKAAEKLWEIAEDRTKDQSDIRVSALYNAACAYALCESLVGQRNPTSDEDRELKGKYHRLAIDSLKSAVDSGFNDFDRMRTDTELDSLRESPEFMEILRALTFPGKLE